MTVIPEITKTERQQKNYYDSIARLYDNHYGNSSALKYRYWVYDSALKNLNLKDLSALDAMCGGGEGTGYLLARGSSVTGLDISEECCAIYNRRFPENKIVCSSILKTEFPDNSFDFILTDSLHHLPPNVDDGLNEIYRLLKPGGYFCCWEPNHQSISDKFRRIWYKLDKNFFSDNEQSINIGMLKRMYSHRFRFVSTSYGGNLAYLLVNCSMAFRIPPRTVAFYAPFLMRIEKILSPLQPRLLSLWVLCLMQKIK